MINIGSERLEITDFERVVFGNEEVALSSEGREKVDLSFQFLKEFSKDKIIYGINTGFGPMAQYKIDETKTKELQLNLIRSHCSGAGEPLNATFSKSIVLARLNTLAKGYSGIHTEVVELLCQYLNKNVSPVIKEHGGVGASGDLVQLAHLALSMIGEGKVYADGKVKDAKDAFREKALTPMSIHIREGLAIMNGTSAMSGIGIVNVIRASNLLHWSVLASSLMNEIVSSYEDHFSEELNRVKLHSGQRYIASEMTRVLSDSKKIRRRADHLYTNTNGEKYFKDKVQEYYSLRCVPQILGPVYDTLKNSEKVLIDEVNSVNDNPVIDASNENVYHGGNFHGDYVSLTLDQLKLAIVRLSMLSERQLNFLLNDKLNGVLPAFLNNGEMGFNYGLQGVQFTATSTVAENQSLSTSVYVHSIPNNNDNQDIVSMGSNAAISLSKVIENAYQVLAIEMMALVHAVKILDIESDLSSTTRSKIEELSKITGLSNEDKVRSEEIDELVQYLQNNKAN